MNPGNIRSKNPKSWELKVVTGNPGDLNVLGAGRRPEIFRRSRFVKGKCIRNDVFIRIFASGGFFRGPRKLGSVPGFPDKFSVRIPSNRDAVPGFPGIQI